MDESRAKPDVLKLLVVGNDRVGKTSLINRFFDGTYSESTLGYFRMGEINGVQLQVWDHGAAVRDGKLGNAAYIGAHGIVIAFDVTDRASYNDLKKWLQEIDRYAMEGVHKIIVGTKTDLAREVTEAEAKEFAQAVGVPYVEVSAKNNTNVNEVFSTLSQGIINSLPAPRIYGGIGMSPPGGMDRETAKLHRKNRWRRDSGLGEGYKSPAQVAIEKKTAQKIDQMFRVEVFNQIDDRVLRIALQERYEEVKRSKVDLSKVDLEGVQSFVRALKGVMNGTVEPGVYLAKIKQAQDHGQNELAMCFLLDRNAMKHMAATHKVQSAEYERPSGQVAPQTAGAKLGEKVGDVLKKAKLSGLKLKAAVAKPQEGGSAVAPKQATASAVAPKRASSSAVLDEEEVREKLLPIIDQLNVKSDYGDLGRAKKAEIHEWLKANNMGTVEQLKEKQKELVNYYKLPEVKADQKKYQEGQRVLNRMVQLINHVEQVNREQNSSVQVVVAPLIPKVHK